MGKKKLALIGSNGIPANYGGTETFYENLTRELIDRYEITVYCSKNNPRVEGNKYLGASLKYWPLSANGWQSIPYDFLSIVHAVRNHDILLIFGSAGLFVVPILRFFGLKKRIFLNHGGLNEWERESYGKLGRFWAKFNRGLVSHKVIHVADNNLYLKSLFSTFGIKAHVIRYGGDNAFKVAPNDALIKKYPFLTEDYYVSVSRAQVDNNLHIVLEAFSKMQEKKLVLVSNFQKFAYGREMYEKYKGYDNIILINGIYDKEELNAVRSNALAYVHSHSRCGTPPSLCEAMYLERPIISFDAEVNHEVTKEYAYFFKDANELIDIVESKTKKDLNQMALKSTKLANEELTWKAIGNQYCDLFENAVD